jgi:4-amino-4-deoxychorismate lyase
MYPLVESIKAENGQFFLLDYHQDRLERTFHAVYKSSCPWQLVAILPQAPSQGLFKVRFLYNATDFSIEVQPYVPKIIKTLKLIEIGDYTYPHKWTDRSAINTAFAQRGNCDDVLMTKNGFLTDASYANIVLFDGTNWVTPEKPLFEGVQRSYLLDHTKIKTASIATTALSNYQSFQLINAINSFVENRFLSVGGIA